MHFVAADDDVMPVDVVAAGLGPIGALEAGVVSFAFEEVGLERGAGGGFPARAGSHIRRRAIGIFEAQLGAQAGVFAVQVAVVTENDVAAEPAVGEDGAQGVDAPANLFGDIVGAV